MPNYNDSAYLREAVDSVLQQSYTSLELIIVDDGSTDDSVAILTDYERRDPRVRLFRNDQNRGAAFTLARAGREARGEYLYSGSSNDKILPMFFEKAVALLEQHPKADLCWTDPCHFFKSDGPLYCRKTGLTSGPAFLSREDLIRLYRDGTLSAPFHANPALFRTAAFRAAGGYLPELRWTSDFFLTMVIAFRTGMCYIPEALACSRVQMRSYSQTAASQESIRTEVFKYLLDSLVSPSFREIAPAVKESGVLSYFGLPMFELARTDAKYEAVIDWKFARRARFFSMKHVLRQMTPPRFQRWYFRLREIIRG
jgi:hypothetical protein